MRYNLDIGHEKCNAETDVATICLLHTEPNLHTQPDNRRIAVSIIPFPQFFVQGGGGEILALVRLALYMDGKSVSSAFLRPWAGGQ